MENKVVKKIVIVIISIVMLAVLVWFFVNDEVRKTMISHIKSETTKIVSSVNNYCAVAEMKQQLTGEINICADGVTIEEARSMAEHGDYEILDIKYENSRVKYLKIKENKLIMEYNGTTYELVKWIEHYWK